MHLFQALLAGTISKPHPFHKSPSQLATLSLDFNMNVEHSVCISAFYFQSIVVLKELEREPHNSTEVHHKNTCNSEDHILFEITTP